MSIADLPKKKNITEFTDKELFLWLKDYIGGWASGGVAPPTHYDAVKAELVRRNNERIIDLTRKIHYFTLVLVILTFILVIFTGVLIFK